jgi:hypothetical protein
LHLQTAAFSSTRKTVIVALRLGDDFARTQTTVILSAAKNLNPTPFSKQPNHRPFSPFSIFDFLISLLHSPCRVEGCGFSLARSLCLNDHHGIINNQDWYPCHSRLAFSVLDSHCTVMKRSLYAVGGAAR